MRGDFAEIYEDHVFRVYGFIAYRIESRADAEDLTQQTFEQALRAWSRFDPERASAGTWLISIARNLLIDRFRREGRLRFETIAEDQLAESELPQVELEPDLGLDHDLAAALAQLSDQAREVIALRFGAELRPAEIAEIMGISVENAHQILSRSLRQLRSMLQQVEGEEGPSSASAAPER